MTFPLAFVFVCLSFGSRAVADQVDRLAADIDALISNGSRTVGYPGAEAASDLIDGRFRELGLQDVRREEFRVGVPIDYGASLVVLERGQSFALSSLWPNMVRTSTVPPKGLELPLVYVGTGEWTELNGHEIGGRVVLMEFNSGLNWLRPASLGAAAVVFIEPDDTTIREAHRKYSMAPLDIPRFWIDKISGMELREQFRDSGELVVELRGRMDWEMAPAWNLLGSLPGTDPELSKEIIVVQAYYDATSVVPGFAPGGTAACGIAALLETALYLKQRQPFRTVLFLATSAHYQAHQGIVDFLNRRVRTHEGYSERFGEPLDISLLISLDLSSGSDQLGVWNSTNDQNLRRYFVPYSRVIMSHAQTAAKELGRDLSRAFINGISPIRGMDWDSYTPGGIESDAEWALSARIPALTIASVNDRRQSEFTPLDHNVSIVNLDRQVAMLKCVLSGMLNDPNLSSGRSGLVNVLKDEMRDLTVHAKGFPRRSQTPDRPVKKAVTVVSQYDKQKVGVHGQRVVVANDDGEAIFRGLFAATWSTAAFDLDPESGAIIQAPDLAKRASAHHGKADYNGFLPANVRWSDNRKTLVLFKARAEEIYSLISPRSLWAFTGPNVMDRAGAPPREFGFAISDYAEEPVGVLFGSATGGEENRLRFVFGGLLGQSVLLLNSQGHETEKEARGVGYLLGSEPLTHTTVKAARDMWQLNEQRLGMLRKHSINSQHLERLHSATKQLLNQADEAGKGLRWGRYVAHAREALGLEAGVYPLIKATLNDVIKGMVFFLALVIPAAFFGERLFFAASDIRRQLLGLAAILSLIWWIISQVHPAFDLAHPLVIVLAFSIMVMAVLVMWMVSLRFNKTAKEYRTRLAQVHMADISRIGAAYVAFMLGISNMRRRKLRTAMTLITLTLLTFSVLSFTSFEDRIRFVAMPTPFESEREGLLIRDRTWGMLRYTAYDYAESHFGNAAVLAPRYWNVSRFKGETRYIDVHHGDSMVRALGMVGLAPAEKKITPIENHLIAGSFFERGDEATCLLPDDMARSLAIYPEDVGKVRVRVFGSDLLVRGIFSASAIDEMKELDGGTLTPIDTRVAYFDPLEEMIAQDNDMLEEEVMQNTALHLPAANVLITPHETQQDLGGVLYSVAVHFHDSANPIELIESYLLRVAAFMHAGLRSNGEAEISVYRYSSVGLTSIQGMGALAIPAVIAALIVLNAMLGAVYERFREIGIYSSVGLAPVHIAVLFFAEATVYAILGVTMGYLLGQGLGKVLVVLDLLSGITLNYSSLSAVVASLSVMVIVLLSTLYPARVAASVAVPEVVRRWRPPAPDGDRWYFPFPFNVSESEVVGTCGFLSSFFTAHSGAVGGRIYTEDVTLSRQNDTNANSYTIRLHIWLAPYDLGVSEQVRIDLSPTADAVGMYSIEMMLERSSGEHLHWRRLNVPFFNVLRRQLLIWNTLSSEVRAGHRKTATTLLETPPDETSPSDDAQNNSGRVISRIVHGSIPNSADTKNLPLVKNAEETGKSPFSWRAMVAGAFGAMAVGIGAPYCIFMLKGSWMAINSTVPIAIFYFFIIVVIANVILALLSRKFALSKADLVMIYVMLTMAAAVPNQAFVGYVIPCIAGFFYYATPENKWFEMYLADIPKWMVPDVSSAELLHEGLPLGQSIPWGGWIEPLSFWYVFFIALSLMMICLNVILHRQWSVHERLEYPMVQLPLHMIERSQGTFAPLGPFFRNRWTWIGFLIPFLLLGLRGLRHYHAAVPTFSPSFGNISLMDGAFTLGFHTNYAWVGISYLVNLDVTLSIWVFWIIGTLEKALFGQFGIAPTEKLSFYSLHSTADLAHQATGACWVFVAWGLWVARHHLKQVLSNAFGRKVVDDSEELLSYRAAVFGLIGSTLFVGVWLWYSGIPLVILPMFLVSAVIFYIMITRVVATAGVATARSPMISAFVVISGFGSALIGTKGLVALTFTYLWHSEMRLFPMIVCANNLKLAEAVRGPKGRLFWAICLALVVSLFSATWIILYLCYTYGGINLHTFFMQSQTIRLFNDMARHIQEPIGPDWRGWWFTGFGAAIESGLIYAQSRFFWWPLHPVGFVIANGWLTGQIWFAVFLGWLSKSIIMKYGGMQMFLAARPFFLGLILGEATAAGTWLVIDYLAGSTGNQLTQM